MHSHEEKEVAAHMDCAPDLQRVDRRCVARSLVRKSAGGRRQPGPRCCDGSARLCCPRDSDASDVRFPDRRRGVDSVVKLEPRSPRLRVCKVCSRVRRVDERQAYAHRDLDLGTRRGKRELRPEAP